MQRQSSTVQFPPPPYQPSQPSPVDPAIWRACAGASVQIPTVNSRVYYFIQGHLEQATSTPENLSRNVYNTPFVLCRNLDVQFLADHNTDEVFVKLVLQPIDCYSVSELSLNSSPPVAAGENSNSSCDENAVVSFAKILTPSDVNNGGGFQVPRFCADSIFRQLNFKDDPPFQNLRMKDVHGNAWRFRHVYRGMPRRHLLTTGWSRFVDSKNLVAGDSVVFMKNSKGKMFAGIHRGGGGGRGGPGTNCWATMLDGAREGLSRNWNEKLAPENVAEAAELAVKGKPFEVVYYPGAAGWSDFVVKEDIVDETRYIRWSPGMRVKMALETDDSSRMSWFQGTVSAVSVPRYGHWRGSPWKMLQVAWDEPEVLQNAKLVSPWQVELVSATPALHTALTSYGTIPVGMQGARHGFFPRRKFYNISDCMAGLHLVNPYANFPAPDMNALAAELKMGSSESDNLSQDSLDSFNSFGIEFLGTHNCSATEDGSGLIQLFGSTIESVLHLPCCTKRDSCKGCNEIEPIDKLGCSLTYSEFLDWLDSGDDQIDDGQIDDGQCNL